MDWMIDIWNTATISALGQALIHSLWQIWIIYLVLLVSLRMIPSQLTSLRYTVSCIAMLLVPVTFYLTLQYNLHHTPHPDQQYSLISQMATTEPAGWLAQALQEKNIVLLWTIGIFICMCYHMIGYASVKQMVRRATPNQNPNLAGLIAEYTKKLGITRAVELRMSHAVASPAVIGHFKPVILLPVCLITHLSDRQIEMIVIHELAHIKRNDFLINLIILAVRNLFYFHPAVWLMAQVLDEERELSCDQVVLGQSISALEYVRALTTLQELRTLPQPSLAWHGQRNSFSRRVKRLFHHPHKQTGTMNNLIIAAVMFVTFTPLSQAQAQSNDDTPADRKEIIREDTLPDDHQIIINGKEVESLEVQKKDGKITRIVIDGKEIPKDQLQDYTAIIENLPPPPAPPLPPAPPIPSSVHPPHPPHPPAPPAPSAPVLPDAAASPATPPGPPTPPSPPAPPAPPKKYEEI